MDEATRKYMTACLSLTVRQYTSPSRSAMPRRRPASPQRWMLIASLVDTYGLRVPQRGVVLLRRVFPQVETHLVPLT